MFRDCALWALLTVRGLAPLLPGSTAEAVFLAFLRYSPVILLISRLVDSWNVARVGEDVVLRGEPRPISDIREDYQRGIHADPHDTRQQLHHLVPSSCLPDRSICLLYFLLHHLVDRQIRVDNRIIRAPQICFPLLHKTPRTVSIFNVLPPQFNSVFIRVLNSLRSRPSAIRCPEYQVPQLPQLFRRHVGGRQKITAQQIRQCPCVVLVRLIFASAIILVFNGCATTT